MSRRFAAWGVCVWLLSGCLASPRADTADASNARSTGLDQAVQRCGLDERVIDQSLALSELARSALPASYDRVLTEAEIKSLVATELALEDDGSLRMGGWRSTFDDSYPTEMRDLPTPWGAAVEPIWDCMKRELNVPVHVRSRMANTSALDGIQSASWGVYSMDWSYHPRDGMNVIITET